MMRTPPHARAPRTDGRPGRASLLVFLAALVGIGVLSALWAVTTPLGASPDEPAHMNKAASVVRGQFLGDVTDDPQVRMVQVPAGVAYSDPSACARHDGDRTADCAPGFPAGDAADRIVSTETSAGLYDPVYYVLVGWPTLIWGGGTMAVFGMRLVSALLCTLLAAGALAYLARLPRPVLPVLATFAALTPMTHSLFGSVNPNAFEIAATAAFAAAYITGLVRGGPVSWRTAAFLAVTGGLLVHARGLSPMWLGVVVVAGACLVGWSRFWTYLRRPQVLTAVGVVAVSTVLAIVWILRTGSLAAVGVYERAGTSFAEGLVIMLERTFDYARDMVGNFGWLDTAIPSYAVFPYFVGWGVIVAAALMIPSAKGGRRAVVVALVGFLLLPALVQASSVTVSGFVWQGRYNLPAYLLLIMVAAVVAAPAFDRVPAVVRRRILMLVAVVHAAAAFVGLMTFLRRNSVGLSASWSDLLLRPRWSPPVVGVEPWILAIAAGSVVAGAALLLAVLAARRDAPTEATLDAGPRGLPGVGMPAAAGTGRGTVAASAEAHADGDPEPTPIPHSPADATATATADGSRGA
ncbi:DUF2142 domain-containing protein [Clavibacter michiganensis subsp. michiganensis]|uniref:DUF2142 domain-containing protein n=1 Tax=Clavibacter michiganensis TaxID=28447 RepID=UPI000B3767E5|nr:DUF2142 domain-containing protein [Clavibacter michiganensis]MWJ04940.1 DUF2142 domain-containing protein [Clavibacter michiganensis subsp. michiganensis]MWJ11001.1 DUF2142 domain-containing protein [Clavibacter michiganensis subsp. michiganensis]MWJ22604.1 DUF2142 domain-containing protein [Clavibacter michiganensis subsp. michiganensis]MWJ45786.1 DUF2142 domain-containing protein [Clavibacter michiganensis subsp. michiganensis]OUD96514.1 hypothetical protein CMMCAS04_02635 [Clavibacter mi